jgi:hypothetical protein
MSKFNKVRGNARGSGPISTYAQPTGLTHEGAPGYAQDRKSELFLLAVSNMASEDTFYETARERDDRYAALVRDVALDDGNWTAAFLAWLRGEANMRSASLVGALEAARGMVAAGIPGSRAMVASVLQRADEPGEALGYWLSRYGRAIPKPVKRGVADAASRLYNERSLLKYDTVTHAVRFADVLDLTHPQPDAAKPWQPELFRVALERRHNRDTADLGALRTITANAALRAESVGRPDVLLDAERLREAGMTWEDALSLAGVQVDKARLWEALIPGMGYMALLRNLRNFDEAGVSDRVAASVAARLADQAEVARSRQLPFRFVSAYEAAPSQRWGHALDTALSLSLRNLPALPGRSLVLVDTSASMTSMAYSRNSRMTPAKAAALFGVALAAKLGSHNVDLVGFADGVFWHRIGRARSVLRQVEKFVARTGEVGHGTNITGALAAAYHRHDRVFVISDMQTMTPGTTDAVPPHIPMYGFNLGGYRHAAYPTGPNRHELGGLTDATFRMIPLIEAGRRGDWPWASRPR